MLELKDGCAYVGVCPEGSAATCIEELVQGWEHAWLNEHKPEKQLMGIPAVLPFDVQRPFEDVRVLFAEMGKRGKANVQGSVFSSPSLSKEEDDFVDRLIRHENDECIECGLRGHFSRNCPKMRVLQQSIASF